MGDLTVFSDKYLTMMKQIAAHEMELKKLKEESDEMRYKLMEAMDANNIRSFENDILKMTLVAPSVSTTIDTKALRLQDPDTYEELLEEYPKVTERRQSIRITIK